MKCLHPSHLDNVTKGKTCIDTAVGCDELCICCVGKERVLFELMQGMDLPPLRLDTTSQSNLQWLKRNMFIRNSCHPNFARAITLVHSLIENG